MFTNITYMERFSSSSSALHHPSRSRRGASSSRRPRGSVTIVAASEGEINNIYGRRPCGFGRKSRSVVDEDMVVLRKRIRELETMDEDRVVPAPEGWMGWEKQYYYERYNSDVCEATAMLREMLLRTRPSLALGLVVLVFTSVSTTGLLALIHLLGFIRN